MFIRHPFTQINPLSIKFEDKEADLDKTLKETIDKSIEDVDKELNKDEPPVEEKEKEVEKEVEEELSPEDLKSAKDLIKALKDPNVAPSVIKAMAAAAGVKLEDVKTEKQEAKVIKTITQLVEEEFGAEFPQLGKKLGAILEKIVPKIVEDNTKDIRENAAAKELKETRNTLEDALTSTFDAYKNVDEKIQQKVYELVDEIPIKPNSDPKTYFTRLVKLAADELNITLVKKDNKVINQDERRTRNRNDVQNKLNEKGETQERQTSSVKSGDMTLAEAIRKGMEEAEDALVKK